MKSSKYLKPIYFTPLMLMEKKSGKKLILTFNWGFTKFDDFLFGMNYYLKELSKKML